MKIEEKIVYCCDKRSGCCAKHDGLCTCLENTDFENGYCPFYKTAETMKEELKDIAIRFLQRDDFVNAKKTVERLVKLS